MNPKFCPFCACSLSVFSERRDYYKCFACGEEFTVLDPAWVDELTAAECELHEYGRDKDERQEAFDRATWLDEYAGDVKSVCKRLNELDDALYYTDLADRLLTSLKGH